MRGSGRVRGASAGGQRCEPDEARDILTSSALTVLENKLEDPTAGLPLNIFFTVRILTDSAVHHRDDKLATPEKRSSEFPANSVIEPWKI